MDETDDRRRRAAVRRVESAFPLGVGDWSKRRFEVWVAAVADLSADAVEYGALDLINGWEGGPSARPPNPAHLRAYAEKHHHRRVAKAPISAELPIDEAALIDVKMAHARALVELAAGRDPLFSPAELLGQRDAIERRLLATERYDCPRCGSVAGRYCVRPDGRETWAHNERTALDGDGDPGTPEDLGRQIMAELTEALRGKMRIPPPRPGDEDHPDFMGPEL